MTQSPASAEAVRCELRAAPVVHWLIEAEPGVKQAVGRFVVGATDGDKIVVAGPPTKDEVAASRARNGHAGGARLPAVVLNLRWSYNSLTQRRAVEIKTDDAGLAELRRWQEEAAHRILFAGGKNRPSVSRR